MDVLIVKACNPVAVEGILEACADYRAHAGVGVLGSAVAVTIIRIGVVEPLKCADGAGYREAAGDGISAAEGELECVDGEVM